jgi:hypothetical protein
MEKNWIIIYLRLFTRFFTGVWIYGFDSSNDDRHGVSKEVFFLELFKVVHDLLI